MEDRYAVAGRHRWRTTRRSRISMRSPPRPFPRYRCAPPPRGGLRPRPPGSGAEPPLWEGAGRRKHRWRTTRPAADAKSRRTPVGDQPGPPLVHDMWTSTRRQSPPTTKPPA
ncbi:hypothetical protein EF902_11140 [Streptomyces sp. WAC05858]|nr:hypothetical protein EF902_11140 [Streptomyces sp. WAC05858]